MADPALRPATVHGYADRLSVAPGETIEFKVSCDEPGSYRADLVRLIHGDTNPAGPGFKEEEIASSINGGYPAGTSRPHPARTWSSTTRTARSRSSAPFTLHAFVFPTTPGKDGQQILGRRVGRERRRLRAHDRGRTAHAADRRRHRSSADVPLWASCWYSVAGTYDPATGRASVYQEPVRNSYNSLLSPMVAIPERARVRRGAGGRPARLR